MNISKKILIAILSVFVVTGYSCKKGENDPGFTLKTRKARITAEWKLKEGQIVEETIEGKNFSTKVISFDGEKMSYEGKSLPYSEILTIERDGTFSKTLKSTTDYNVSQNESPKIIDITTNQTGVWYFIGGSKNQEYEKKERVAFETLSIVTSSSEAAYTPISEKYTGTQNAEILVLDRLARTEIVITIDNSVEYNNENGELFRRTSKGTLTYEKN